MGLLRSDHTVLRRCAKCKVYFHTTNKHTRECGACEDAAKIEAQIAQLNVTGVSLLWSGVFATTVTRCTVVVHRKRATREKE